MSHTPGPWRIAFDTEITTSLSGIVEESKQVAECGNALKPTEEVKANARLIAAAPELLAALIEMNANYGPTQPYQERATLKARAAIAKAKGE